jgi:hypothetical protein
MFLKILININNMNKLIKGRKRKIFKTKSGKEYYVSKGKKVYFGSVTKSIKGRKRKIFKTKSGKEYYVSKGKKVYFGSVTKSIKGRKRKIFKTKSGKEYYVSKGKKVYFGSVSKSIKGRKRKIFKTKSGKEYYVSNGKKVYFGNTPPKRTTRASQPSPKKRRISAAVYKNDIDADREAANNLMDLMRQPKMLSTIDESQSIPHRTSPPIDNNTLDRLTKPIMMDLLIKYQKLLPSTIQGNSKTMEAAIKGKNKDILINLVLSTSNRPDATYFKNELYKEIESSLIPPSSIANQFDLRQVSKKRSHNTLITRRLKDRFPGLPDMTIVEQTTFLRSLMYPYNYNRSDIYNSPTWRRAISRGDYKSITDIIEGLSPDHFNNPRCPGCNAVQSKWGGRQHEHIWDAGRDIRTGLTITEYIDNIKNNYPRITNEEIFDYMEKKPMEIGYTHAINTMPMCDNKGINCNHQDNWKLKNSIIQSRGGWPSNEITDMLPPHTRGGHVITDKKDRKIIEQYYLTPAYRNLLSLNLPMSFEYPTIHDRGVFLTKLATPAEEDRANMAYLRAQLAAQKKS